MREERGSAVVESVFGTFVLLFLAVGAIQVALTLYARNVVMAAVHDGARAAVELDAEQGVASTTANRVIDQAAGALFRDRSIQVLTAEAGERHSVTVVASGRVASPGPIPIEVPITVRASATREVVDAPGT